MSGEWLALGAAAALAAASVTRRRGARNECSGPYFHTTTWDRLQSIAEDGLVPGYGSRFGGWYESHSQGRTFLAQGEWEAGEWYDAVSRAVEQGAEIREEDELPAVVPVMLRIDARGLTLHEDEAAKIDGKYCSVYTTQEIAPSKIWFYDGSSDIWRPIQEWNDSDPMAAFQSWDEEWDEDEDEEDRTSWINFDLREPWDDDGGAFAPERHNEAAAQKGWSRQLGR